MDSPLGVKSRPAYNVPPPPQDTAYVPPTMLNKFPCGPHGVKMNHNKPGSKEMMAKCDCQ